MMGDGVWAEGEGGEDDDEGFWFDCILMGTVREKHCCFTLD